jgi:transglutaminase-like putative cysteine protease
MQIRVGYELIYDCPQPTPMLLMLNVHHSRVADLVVPDQLVTDPPLPIRAYHDGYDGIGAAGSWPSRAGRDRKHGRGQRFRQAGSCRRVRPTARGQDLPDCTLVFLLGSRYCETDHLSETAWRLFGQTQSGWARVQAICDFVHAHIAFDYAHARATRTAWEAFQERRGVCRDFAHLAVTLCRCMNIPARYCTGYLSDVGVPPPHSPMDFAGWFEAYLDGAWHTFDPRNNTPRIGRVLIARGRDAADVPISNTFGPNTLTSFKVWTDELPL